MADIWRQRVPEYGLGPMDLCLGTANSARVWDYLRHGKDNYPPDRDAVRYMLQLNPHLSTVVLDNSYFRYRVLRFLVGRGVRQFIDIGCGLPTDSTVHGVIGDLTSGGRVVYVDVDPLVATFASALMRGKEVGAVEADLCDPAAILTHHTTRELINFGAPVAVLLTAVLDLVPDEVDPWALVGELMEALPGGSYLVVSHLTSDSTSTITQIAETCWANITLRPRTLTEVGRFFNGLELLPPGLIWTPQWRPEFLPGDLDEQRLAMYGGVALKTPGTTGRPRHGMRAFLHRVAA